jgi:hypothetical protein
MDMGAQTRGGTRVARLRNGGRFRGPAVVLAIAAIVAGCADTPPTPPPSAVSSPAGTAAPSSSPGATAVPTPTPPPDDAWSPVVIPDATPVATVEPIDAGVGGMATTTAFRLTSLDGTPPADLAARLTVDPQVKLTVASTEGSTAILRPATALHPATLYRVALHRADGSIEASWAAQTAGPLHVVESIPGDSATGVPLDAGIELVFDQAGVTAADLQAHLRIEPATAGRVQVAGRSLAFVPARQLQRGTLYTVTVTAGLPIAGSGQVLEAPVTIRFETGGRARSRIVVRPVRSFLEATPRELAAMALWIDRPDQADPPGRVPVALHSLPTIFIL